jgi:cathepsin K
MHVHEANHSLIRCIARDVLYDARDHGLIPPVRERKCDACWAYAVVGIIESSHIRINGAEPGTTDLSEKQLIAFAGRQPARNCRGFVVDGLHYLKGKKIMDEIYAAEDGRSLPRPEIHPSAIVELEDWDLVDPDLGMNQIARTTKIKEALCQYGPVATSMRSNPRLVDYEKGTVFFDKPSDKSNPRSNHALIIIGWDDNRQAWLVRNCWGIHWGDGGYGWIHYNTNNIGVNTFWAKVKKIDQG